MPNWNGPEFARMLGIGSRVIAWVRSRAVKGCFGVLTNVGGLNVWPPSTLVAMYVAARASDASNDASYHMTTTVPVVGSTETLGMNCIRLPVLVLSVTVSVFTRIGLPAPSPCQ